MLPVHRQPTPLAVRLAVRPCLRFQYIGATVVIAGIIVTLIPTFLGHPSGGDDADAAMQIVWSGVQVTDYLSSW